jgi:tRNA pseudouridine38-40 synthase
LLAYDGAAYRGWQVQPGVPTVQGRVLEALRPLTRGEVRLVGASRTDAGVHALGQVASVETVEPVAPRTVLAALNARLPRDIRVLAVRTVPPDFDARRTARLKRYGYLLETGPVAWPFLRDHAWHVGHPLDTDAMAQALAPLRGKRDFAAFCAAPGRGRDPVCSVRAVRVVARGDRVGVLMSADSFLHHMVRNVVGTLVEVGLGRRPPGWVADVLAGRDRRAAGPTAPPQGLHLLRVLYPWSVFAGGLPRAQGKRR